MAERADSSQNPKVKSERPESLIVSPSSLEAAFDAEVQSRFNVRLLEPFLDEYNRLVRLTIPVVKNGTIIAFQYTRYNPLADRSEATMEMLQAHNPTIGQEIASSKLVPQNEERDEFDEIEEELEMKKNIVDAVRNSIIARNGLVDPLKALTDPAYFTEGEPIKSWPESFEAVIFDAQEPLVSNIKPAQIERNGKINGLRPEVWITLSTPMDHLRNYHKEGRLIIKHPRREYETLKAFATIYHGGVRRSRLENNGLDFDDIGWFPLSKQWEEPVFPTLVPPQKIMEDFVGLIVELTRPTR